MIALLDPSTIAETAPTEEEDTTPMTDTTATIDTTADQTTTTTMTAMGTESILEEVLYYLKSLIEKYRQHSIIVL